MTTEYYVYYVRKFQCSPGCFGPKDKEARKTAIKHIQIDNALEKWENIRFLIERSLGLHSGLFHKQQHQSKNAVYSYITGDLFQGSTGHATVIQDTDLISHGSCIIITMKQTSIKPKIPAKYAAKVSEALEAFARSIPESKSAKIFTEGMTEEQKISAISDTPVVFCSGTCTGTGTSIVTTDEVQSSLASLPPYWYVCHRCGQTGHWKNQCPDKDYSRRTVLRPLGSLKPKECQRVPKIAKGIPMSDLKPVETEEERERAMLDSNGNLVCLKFLCNPEFSSGLLKQ